MLCEVRGRLHSFVGGCPVFPTPLAGKKLLNGLDTLAKNQLTLQRCAYFWTLRSTPLTYRSGKPPAAPAAYPPCPCAVCSPRGSPRTRCQDIPQLRAFSPAAPGEDHFLHLSGRPLGGPSVTGPRGHMGEGAPEASLPSLHPKACTSPSAGCSVPEQGLFVPMPRS